MIRLRVGNIFAEVEGFDAPSEESALVRALTFVVPNYYFMASFKKGVWDGTYCFYNKYSKRFPAGLLTVLPEHLKAGVLTIDARQVPKAEQLADGSLRGIELRDYQIAAVEAAMQKQRCIVMAPTNAGKTEIGASIIKRGNGQTLWLTHRGNLMYQTRDRLEERLGQRVGLVYQNVCDVQKVTIGMVQTLYKRVFSKDKDVKSFFRKWLFDLDMLMFDECHNVSATSWRSLAKNCNAFWRIGLSATPLLRSEIQNLWLIGMTGETIKTVTNRDLVERGISAKPRIIRVKNEMPMRLFQRRNYHDSYLTGVELNDERNRIIGGFLNLHRRKREPVLVLVNTIRHGSEVMKLAPEGTVFLTGLEDVEYRNEILKACRRGEVAAIVATPIFDEGVDAPEVRAVVLAGAGKSHLRLLQRIGRGMRRKPAGSENVVTIYDFEDRGDRYLEGHSLYRLKLYVAEGFDVIPTQVIPERGSDNAPTTTS